MNNLAFGIFDSKEEEVKNYEVFDGRVELKDLEKVAARIEAGSLRVRTDMDLKQLERRSGKLWYIKKDALFCEHQLMHQSKRSHARSPIGMNYCANGKYYAVAENFDDRKSAIFVYTCQSQQLVLNLEFAVKADRFNVQNIIKVKGLGHLLIAYDILLYSIHFWLLDGLRASSQITLEYQGGRILDIQPVLTKTRLNLGIIMDDGTLFAVLEEEPELDAPVDEDFIDQQVEDLENDA